MTSSCVAVVEEVGCGVAGTALVFVKRMKQQKVGFCFGIDSETKGFQLYRYA